MEPREVLEAQVAVVAALGELVATVTAPYRDMWPLLYPRSLHKALREFTWHLRETLERGDVTSLGYRSVTSLGQALATLGATPGATWADVRAAATDWGEAVAAIEDCWCWLFADAEELRDTTKKATTTSLAGDLRDETGSGGTAGDNLVAAAWQPPVALPSMASVAATQAGATTRRGQEAEEALGLLRRLVATCQEPWEDRLELEDWVDYIESTPEGTEKVASDVPKALVAAVAEAKQLWEASAHLTKHHLLVTLGDIYHLLSSPCGGSGGPAGPCGRAMAKRCQKAIKDIPKLLGGQ